MVGGIDFVCAKTPGASGDDGANVARGTPACSGGFSILSRCWWTCGLVTGLETGVTGRHSDDVGVGGGWL